MPPLSRRRVGCTRLAAGTLLRRFPDAGATRFGEEARGDVLGNADRTLRP
jgi:hypothetical protein